MHNIKVISEYLDASAAEAEGCGVIRFMNSLDGENYAVCDGNYWRVCRFVDNSVSFETAEDPRVLRSAGYAFGRFQRLLAGLPMGTLYETIPDFHNTKKRLSSFFDTAAADPEGRLKGVMDEVKFFERNASTASKLCDLLDEGSLPLRVTHNDTKYNNILLDKDTLEPLCVIDLDTVMPGLTMYDFGDAVRFAANRAVEDETDLRRVGLDPAGYEEFTNGFISASRDFLTEGEVANMALGAIVITIELASRFLADHINGDKYFRIHRENHNLDRARCQIRLAEDMMYRFGEMNRIVRKYYQ